jgi:DNA-binding NarL/FixJ family response regulator
MNEDPDLASEATRIGTSGYLLKTCATSELLHAIRELLRGRSYVTPQVARRMQEAFIRDPRPKERHEALTSRQREMIQILAEGKFMKEAADALKVSPSTVAFHKYQIMKELQLKTTADLIRFAIKTRIAAACPGFVPCLKSSYVSCPIERYCSKVPFKSLTHTLFSLRSEWDAADRF